MLAVKTMPRQTLIRENTVFPQQKPGRVPRRISKADYNKIISDVQSTLGDVIVGRRGNWSVNDNEWGKGFAEKAQIGRGGCYEWKWVVEV